MVEPKLRVHETKIQLFKSFKWYNLDHSDYFWSLPKSKISDK